MFGKNSNLQLLTKRIKKEFIFPDNNILIEGGDSKLENDILILENFVTSEFCDYFIDFFKDRKDWIKSVTYGEIENQQDPATSPRQSSQINLYNFKNADNAAYIIFNSALEILRHKYEHVAIANDEGYALLKYSPGGHYSAHVDHGVTNGRILSGLIYLNSDYKGGEIYFPRQNFKLKPTKGMVVMFPSSYTHLHASLPIEEGTKYSIVTWFK